MEAHSTYTTLRLVGDLLLTSLIDILGDVKCAELVELVLDQESALVATRPMALLIPGLFIMIAKKINDQFPMLKRVVLLVKDRTDRGHMLRPNKRFLEKTLGKLGLETVWVQRKEGRHNRALGL